MLSGYPVQSQGPQVNSLAVKNMSQRLIGSLGKLQNVQRPLSSFRMGVLHFFFEKNMVGGDSEGNLPLFS